MLEDAMRYNTRLDTYATLYIKCSILYVDNENGNS